MAGRLALQQRQSELAQVAQDVVACELCPRLRAWCTRVAAEKVRRFAAQEYWGRPVAGWGDAEARLLIVGLAPAAHGANRTGRIFTGDRSGDFLFAALHRAGFASQPESRDRADGLALHDCYITAVARCAPPANKPTAAESLACRTYLLREWRLLARVRAVLVLGRIAQDGFLDALQDAGTEVRRATRRFGHGVTHDLGAGLRLFASYHPSQQNTFTGRLTAASFDSLLAQVAAYLAGAPAR